MSNQIKQLKDKIEEVHKLEADTLKLIAYGKVMDQDDKTLADFKIKEGDFLVVMQQKVSGIKFYEISG